MRHAPYFLWMVMGSMSAMAQPPRYQVTNLSSLGGTASSGNSLDDLGLITGASNLGGDQIEHAALWFGEWKQDLGTLGGLNSAVIWPVKNNIGLFAGISQTTIPDPLSESWSCAAFLPTSTGTTCVGFVWEWGHMRALPTLGGNNGFAAGANNRRQITGWAENTVRDPSCTNGQVLQFRPVIWGPDPKQVHELPLPDGDSSGAATAINDRGQAVGISGICDQAVGRFSAIHALLWQDGSVRDLGSLGGVAWNTPMAINQAGAVVGFANVPGGAGPGSLHEHAFLWTAASGMIDLQTLPGDVHSQALGINARRQVVGVSCTAHFASCRPFLWQDGVMVDLNTLLAPGYADVLVAANDINDWGQITGQAFVAATGALLAFRADPQDAESTSSLEPQRSGAAGRTLLSERTRQQLLKQLRIGTAEHEE